MAIEVTYLKTGKWVAVDGSLFQYYYGEDFNPINNTRPSSWDTATAYEETTNFNLSGFQVWNEIWCTVLVIKNTGSSTESWSSLSGIFQRYSWWWQTTWTYNFGSDSLGAWGEYAAYLYYGIDEDEVRPWYTRYRIIFDSSAFSATSPEFTVSNLSFDSSPHPCWYLRLEWWNLCFTDAYYSSTRWFKHIINRDPSYSEYVWSDSKWHIWLPTTSTDNHIYYVDNNWYKRRTNPSQPRYDTGDAYAWSGAKWHIWVSDAWDMEWWAWHLCYVNNQWYKRRITNWWVS